MPDPRWFLATVIAVALAVVGGAWLLAGKTRFPGLGMALVLAVVGMSAMVAGTRLSLAEGHPSVSGGDPTLLLQAAAASRVDLGLGVVATVLVLVPIVASFVRIPEHGWNAGWVVATIALLLGGWPLLSVVGHAWQVVQVMGEWSPELVPPLAQGDSLRIFSLMGAGVIAFGLGSLMGPISLVLGWVSYGRWKRDQALEAEA